MIIRERQFAFVGTTCCILPRLGNAVRILSFEALGTVGVTLSDQILISLTKHTAPPLGGVPGSPKRVNKAWARRNGHHFVQGMRYAAQDPRLPSRSAYAMSGLQYAFCGSRGGNKDANYFIERSKH